MGRDQMEALKHGASLLGSTLYERGLGGLAQVVGGAAEQAGRFEAAAAAAEEDEPWMRREYKTLLFRVVTALGVATFFLATLAALTAAFYAMLRRQLLPLALEVDSPLFFDWDPGSKGQFAAGAVLAAASRFGTVDAARLPPVLPTATVELRHARQQWQRVVSEAGEPDSRRGDGNKLSSGFYYDVWLELVAPEPDRVLGNFMVSAELLNGESKLLASSRRPALLRGPPPALWEHQLELQRQQQQQRHGPQTVAPAALVCEHSRSSARMRLAQRWLAPLRQVAPHASAESVFVAMFSPLARLLRGAALLLLVAQDGVATGQPVGTAEVAGAAGELGSHVLDLSEAALASGDLDEVEVLWSQLLGLPPLDALLSGNMLKIISAWKAAAQSFASGHAPPAPLRCCLDRTRLTLIALPDNYEQLLSHISRAGRCPSTGKPMRSPALCLRCGAVVCSLQSCCKRGGQGAGTAHAKACGGGSCAFLLAQRCVVVLVHGSLAVDLSAPYVDSHGETDDDLRRGRPLKFHEQAYRNLQFICANNEICHRVVSIARKNDNRQLFNPDAF